MRREHRTSGRGLFCDINKFVCVVDSAKDIAGGPTLDHFDTTYMFLNIQIPPRYLRIRLEVELQIRD